MRLTLAGTSYIQHATAQAILTRILLSLVNWSLTSSHSPLRIHVPFSYWSWSTSWWTFIVLRDRLFEWPPAWNLIGKHVHFNNELIEITQGYLSMAELGLGFAAVVVISSKQRKEKSKPHLNPILPLPIPNHLSMDPVYEFSCSLISSVESGNEDGNPTSIFRSCIELRQNLGDVIIKLQMVHIPIFRVDNKNPNTDSRYWQRSGPPGWFLTSTI